MKPNSFYIDAQTYADLSVFERDRSSFSLSGLFRKTKTIGGADRLAGMMRSPTNDIHQLRLRSAAISCFMQNGIELNINHDQFDLITHYINFDKGRVRGNLIDSWLSYVGNKLRESASYYRVLIGLQQLLKLYQYGFELVSVLEEADSEYLKQIGGRLKNILDSPELNLLKALCNKKNLRFNDVGRLDSTIRGGQKLLILELLDIYYELDVLECLAKVAKQRGFCIAQYDDDESASITIKGLFYPGINPAVTNDVAFAAGEQCILLTGSNMAGKSSFLRSLATATYLAHLGFPVCATSMQTTVMNGLMTTINLGDRLENGLSHYLNEVIRVRTVAELLNKQNKMMVLFDELFRGTNPNDALTASTLVVQGFAKIRHSVFVVSSHLSQLGTTINSPHVVFKQMEHVTERDRVRFTYKLKNGLSTEGIGMYFIKQEKIESLLNQAGLL